VTGQQNWIFILKIVSTKTIRCELHKSNIHSRAAIAKPLITENNTQMRKRWCHDRKTWTPDNWKRARYMVRWVVIHAVPYIRRVYVWRTPRETYNPEELVPTVKRWGNSVMVWAAISWYSILFVPLLSIMAKLLQGSMWTGSVITYIPWSRRYSRTTMQFSKTAMPPFTQLELFSNGSKSMKVNFNIFPGQHYHQIWTALNHSGQFWRLEWGTDSHLQLL
jgi:hypothetical protein